MGVRWPITNEDQVRAYVALRPDARCPRCRHELRDTDGAACPACGEPLSVPRIVGRWRFQHWLRVRHALRWGAVPDLWSDHELALLVGANAIAAVGAIGVSVGVTGDIPPAVWICPAVLGAAAALTVCAGSITKRLARGLDESTWEFVKLALVMVFLLQTTGALAALAG